MDLLGKQADSRDGFVARKGTIEKKRQSTKRFFIAITLIKSPILLAD